MTTPIAGEQVLSYVQAERARTSVRWHRPEFVSQLRRDLGA